MLESVSWKLKQNNFKGFSIHKAQPTAGLLFFDQARSSLTECSLYDTRLPGPVSYILLPKPFGEENNLLNEKKKYIQARVLLLYPDRNPNPL